MGIATSINVATELVYQNTRRLKQRLIVQEVSSTFLGRSKYRTDILPIPGIRRVN